jgi:uncharacterized protein
MKQIMYIHGGDIYSNYKNYLSYLESKKISLETYPPIWKDTLEKDLKQFQIIKPSLPCKDNAKYKEWKIVFEKYLEKTNKKLILIGFSLGGIFLAKYLSENKTNKDFLGVFLVAPPFDGKNSIEDFGGGFNLKKDLSKLNKITNLHLFFSENDSVVPIQNALKYKEKLSNAKIHIYKDKQGHFITPNFPELIKEIRKIGNFNKN